MSRWKQCRRYGFLLIGTLSDLTQSSDLPEFAQQFFATSFIPRQNATARSYAEATATTTVGFNTEILVILLW
jgi:hypothetical protein